MFDSILCLMMCEKTYIYILYIYIYVLFEWVGVTVFPCNSPGVFTSLHLLPPSDDPQATVAMLNCRVTPVCDLAAPRNDESLTVQYLFVWIYIVVFRYT